MVLHYNAIKGVVDVLDQHLNTCTCKRKTNRWSIIVFGNMIDTSACKAFILLTSMESKWNEKFDQMKAVFRRNIPYIEERQHLPNDQTKNKLTKRRMFSEELGKLLIFPYIEGRQHLPIFKD
ncbi:hypothetical protein NPIL_685311 [Nephila pilipes]|uniref:Uncharacterized protein n=1 Tax=Nephila pilipes TaxID=299642 RepID=A0A8X6Q0I5_NEPPI|nr:hypothetical protein NPIL_685311 [Nephila pilipes]